MILQYIATIAIYLVCFSLVKKKAKVARNIVPILFTVGLSMILPLYQVLPDALIFAMNISI